MSSDNYYTIRQTEDGSWKIYHGFMSNLQDGFPATGGSPESFPTEAEALAFYREQPMGFMESYYSEYGLLKEPEADELRKVRLDYFRRWPEDLSEEWFAIYREEAAAAGISVPAVASIEETVR